MYASGLISEKGPHARDRRDAAYESLSVDRPHTHPDSELGGRAPCTYRTCVEAVRHEAQDSSPIPTNLSRHRGPKSPRNSSKPLSGPGVVAAPCPGFTDEIRRDPKLTEEYSLDQKVQQLLSPEQIRSSVGGSVGLAHPVSYVIPRAR